MFETNTVFSWMTKVVFFESSFTLQWPARLSVFHCNNGYDKEIIHARHDSSFILSCCMKCVSHIFFHEQWIRSVSMSFIFVGQEIVYYHIITIEIRAAEFSGNKCIAYYIYLYCKLRKNPKKTIVFCSDFKQNFLIFLIKIFNGNFVKKKKKKIREACLGPKQGKMPISHLSIQNMYKIQKHISKQ